MDKPKFPPFSLTRLLRTVFAPKPGERVALLIDLPDPRMAKNFTFLKDDTLTIQRYAYDVFYEGLRNGGLAELNLIGGDLYAYRITGGSNLDLPSSAFDSGGKELKLEQEIFPNYDIILCISTYSATAPLTAFAHEFGFRGATLHGLNEIILRTGLAVDYNEVSRNAEKLRLGLTRADSFEIDFEVLGQKQSLRLLCQRQEAQKSHGLCRGEKADVANLPAGEVYFVPGFNDLCYCKAGKMSWTPTTKSSNQIRSPVRLANSVSAPRNCQRPDRTFKTRRFWVLSMSLRDGAITLAAN